MTSPPTFDPPAAEPLNGVRHITPHSPDAALAGHAIAVPGAAAWLAPADPVLHAVMIEHIRRAGVGRELVERAAELIGDSDTRTYPPLMIAAGDADGVHVLVHGPLNVHADVTPTNLPPLHVTLASEIDDPVIRSFSGLATLHVGPAPGHVVAIDSLTELFDGVVQASGLTIRWGYPTDAPIGGRTRMPVLSGRRLASPSVPGVLCRRHHFNNPAARFCSQCGITLQHGHMAVVEQQRPPLGIFVFDTGEAFELASDISIGRDPVADNLVAHGLARPLTPVGDVSGLSRVHASVHLDGWNVLLRDRGSLNGTFIWDRHVLRWTRLAPHVPTLIAHGDMVGFGQRWATFEAPIRPS